MCQTERRYKVVEYQTTIYFISLDSVTYAMIDPNHDHDKVLQFLIQSNFSGVKNSMDVIKEGS